MEILKGIKNINELKTFDETEEELREDLVEAFSDNCYSTILEDGTEVELSKDYKCVLHKASELEGTEVYKIDGGELFKCFECGTFLVERNDLVEKYSDEVEDLFYGYNILFPKKWSEERIIEWIKKAVNNKKNYEAEREKRWESREQFHSYDDDYEI